MSLGEIIGKNRTTGVIKVCCLTPLSLYTLLGSNREPINTTRGFFKNPTAARDASELVSLASK